jgi:thioredoxin reductase
MNVLIIGNGIAGTSCARMLRRLQPDHASCGITMISQEAPYHFSRPAMMYISTGQLTLEHTKPFADASWTEQGIALMHGRVTALDAVGRSCTLDDGRVLAADVMVLATGSVPSVPAHLDASLRGVFTYTQLADVQRLNDVMKGANHAVIIGGGLIAAECAEIFACMMEDRDSSTITCVVREDGFYGNVLPDHESMIVTEHLRRHGVRVVTNTEAVRLVDVDGRVTRVELSNGTHLPADCVVVATGVLAIGDCAQPPWGVRQLWYTGRLHGEHAARIVLGQAGAFTPTTDFNSAKFFDLDWSTYGMVRRSSDAVNSRLLIDRDGVRCIRLAHNDAGCVVGIHALGVRLDQRVCEKWIGGRVHVQAAIADISSVIFDAEFTPSFNAVTA